MKRNSKPRRSFKNRIDKPYCLYFLYRLRQVSRSNMYSSPIDKVQYVLEPEEKYTSIFHPHNLEHDTIGRKNILLGGLRLPYCELVLPKLRLELLHTTRGSGYFIARVKGFKGSNISKVSVFVKVGGIVLCGLYHSDGMIPDTQAGCLLLLERKTRKEVGGRE